MFDAPLALIKTAFGGILANGKLILIGVCVAAGLFLLYKLYDTGKQIGTIAEKQQETSEQLKSLTGVVSDLKQLGLETRNLQQQQMDLTNKLASQYNKDKENGDVATAGYLDSVNSGTLRMRFKSTGTRAPLVLPYPNGVSPNNAPGATTPSGTDVASPNHPATTYH